MGRFVVRRLLQSALLLFAVTTASFFLVHAAPGGPELALLSDPRASRESLERMRVRFGLNEPLPVQYLKWLRNVAELDFGRSYSYQLPVTTIVAGRAWPTLQLGLLSYAFGLLGIPLGVYAALHRARVGDNLVRLLTVVGSAVPHWWLGLGVIVLMSSLLGWFPNGQGSEGPWDWLRHIAVPALLLGLGGLITFTRFVRSEVLEVLGQDYVRTAHAKGLPQSRVSRAHVLRNALIPVVTLLGYLLPALLSGAVIIEYIFNWPGMGRLFFEAATTRDYPLLLGMLLLGSALTILGTLLADIGYGLVDPRIRYGQVDLGSRRAEARPAGGIPLAVDDAAATPTTRPQARSYAADALRRFVRDRLSLAALAVFALIVLGTALAPWLAANVLHTSPEELLRTPDGRIATLQPPGPGYPLGTDELGRDNLTRLLYAGRVSLTIGFLVAFVASVIGTSLGLVAAYYGGRTDDLVNALVQFVLNVPGLFVLIILSVLFTPTVLSLALIFGLFFWPGTARQVRGEVLSIRSRDYVLAARLLGAGDARILIRHILPNVASIVIVVAGIDVAAAILGESALSFLGFGVPVPLASWGNMLSGSQDTFRSAPWLVYPPGLMIFLTVLCVFLLADGLRDALDPRLRD